MTDDIYSEISGNGPDLVLIHGWGLHGGLWQGVSEALSNRYRVHCIDLPGHGKSPLPVGEYSIATLARSVAANVPADSHWVGWSLGGMVAMQAAASGAPIRRLITVGSSPRFVQADDWPNAIPADVLEGFASGLDRDYRTTLMRFLALQAMGSERAREEMRRLRESVFAHGEPATAALAGGLAILRHADLRPSLGAIHQTTTMIHGLRDTLVPTRAAEACVAQLANGKLVTIPGAGHAPFISHPEQFLSALEHALDE